jgi:hypothetical protein
MEYDPPCGLTEVSSFQLTYAATGRLIRVYARQAPALAFVRDVVRFGSRRAAAQFELRAVDAELRSTVVAQGELLVSLALADPVL